MILTDVNVIIYAHRQDCERHTDYREWLERTVDSPEAFGVSELILSSFVRVVTNPRAFPSPTPTDLALKAAERLRERPNCVLLAPGPRHWDIFAGLCRAVGARGNIVADAYFAALAIEHGAEWATTDRDYARFPGLRWRHPLDGR